MCERADCIHLQCCAGHAEPQCSSDCSFHKSKHIRPFYPSSIENDNTLSSLKYTYRRNALLAGDCALIGLDSGGVLSVYTQGSIHTGILH